ncbi:uncharacterized protein Tco025E_00918 [Trypanosoma conorhini]|uniref:Uncharacterized protein n=1 Tax=Trypanosoma conorhini TaxID=83891 RepID=A0A3R7LEJ4_9TRYP|nr:uncharacterized protein Tco025E_00918 [Trypanosoma conorhini]RNF26836.1 hypothetical protein Tco025E_00918 [Trypanosoma conorhini]
MLRRWLPTPWTAGLRAARLGASVRCAGDWQPRTKQRHRFSKAAMMEGRERHQRQKSVAALRQRVNEEHGLQQRERAQLRRRYDRTASALIHGASKRSSASAADALATARHLLTLQEATRRAMRGGKSGRTAMFVSGKEWRG